MSHTVKHAHIRTYTNIVTLYTQPNVQLNNYKYTHVYILYAY